MNRDDTVTNPGTLAGRLARAARLWLFLDYDGTLADFSPTPEEVAPDPALADLIARLAQQPRLRVTIISGRPLDHIRRLVPAPGIWLAGTYGIEMETPDGERWNRVELDAVRPALEALKPRWEQLIAGCAGFHVEDKGWTLALHARFADDGEAEKVLAVARRLAADAAADAKPGLFRILGGHKFLEIGPALAHKGRSVEYLLDREPWPGAVPVYLGDDDKDEEAFGVIQARGGVAILVAAEARPTQADLRLESTQAARRWLATLIE
jgi:trehalose 6-phosphate phosphatase